MSGRALGLDTSNYTTSAALFDGHDGINAGRLLDVPEGALGLRQSDALFAHVKRLPELMKKLEESGMLQGIGAVGASTRPRAIEGSYMPCFLAGASQGQGMASVLGVPFFSCSHQQGHIAAAAWSAGRMDLLDTRHLAWHLSGGTTELLFVEPDGKNVKATCIGGTTDISAGQLIDRTGKLLGISFPAGKGLDELSKKAEQEKHFTVKVQDKSFSLSGMENKAIALVQQGMLAGDVAYYVLRSVAEAVVSATEHARRQYPGCPVLCSGGVASNRLLREVMENSCGAVFAPPAYSTDNAMGVAVLTYRCLG